jgi:ribosome biogenesis ATPase
VFARARASSPCIIFFDELDALVPRRDDNLSESSARVVNTLLTELDGLEARKQVYVIGATNRPDIVDPAMVRPGRLDKMLYVDLPTPTERIAILKAQAQKTPFAPDVDWQSIAHDPQCDRFSGADLSALIRESALAALRDAFASGLEGTQVGLQVRMKHLKQALPKVSPSVSVAQLKRYEALRNKFAGQPVGHKREPVEELNQEA